MISFATDRRCRLHPAGHTRTRLRGDGLLSLAAAAARNFTVASAHVHPYLPLYVVGVDGVSEKREGSPQPIITKQHQKEGKSLSPSRPGGRVRMYMSVIT